MHGTGKILIVIGVVILIVGIILALGIKIPLIGKLPGDIHFKRGNFSVYFPIGTSIAVSIGISLLLYILNKLFR
ncbi:MAG: DUF2905 domain-containing protein [Chlorobiota bacterium]|nr:MAG: DUF2905 domain-containing protein [Chlorobiota bacterium]MBW7855822.1 DUF2905 domain-containing protein [Ignavibacteria bacterium]MCE7953195.1 DUF2905 domain-containing protein [Chlorobi bacterium CHB7]OQY76558.1 MAG: hypothetical protein B6D43_10290 [Ignavibacteriales bacterium UTCHB1]RIK50133.1 MAG: DUF2905 domain-containing protein [Ignavibacteriota bacterium]